MSDHGYPKTSHPPSSTPGTGSPPTLRTAGEDLRAAASGARAAASEVAGTVSQEASAAAQTLKEQGAEVVQAVQSRAEDAAKQGVRFGADKAEGLARAVHRAASELEETSPQLAHIVHDAAGTVDGIARSLRDSSPRDMLQGVQDFARRNPLAFFGASVVAGFALARFVRASRPEPQHDPYAGGHDMYGTPAMDMPGGRSHGAYSGSGTSSAGMRQGMAHGATDFHAGSSGMGSSGMGSSGTGSSGMGGSSGTGGPGMSAASGLSTSQSAATTSSHGTATGAPGWVANDDGTSRPATLASASLGGAAAKQTPSTQAPFGTGSKPGDQG